MSRSLAAAVLLSLAASTSAFGAVVEAPVGRSAQSIVHVGDGTLNGSHIKAYDNVWLVSVHYADGRLDERGLSSDHVRFRKIDGKTYLTRTEGTTSVVGKAGGAVTSNFTSTFNVFDPLTMRPRQSEAYSSDGAAEIRRFEGKHVTTITRQAAGGPERAVEADTPEPVFDVNGGMTGLLLAAAPLRLGYTAVLPGMGDTGPDTTQIRVVGKQTVSAGFRGPMTTWVVEIGPSPSTSTYWISKRPPYVLRATVKGANAVASWDIIG